VIERYAPDVFDLAAEHREAVLKVLRQGATVIPPAEFQARIVLGALVGPGVVVGAAVRFGQVVTRLGPAGRLLTGAMAGTAMMTLTVAGHVGEDWQRYTSGQARTGRPDSADQQLLLGMANHGLRSAIRNAMYGATPTAALDWYLGRQAGRMMFNSWADRLGRSVLRASAPKPAGRPPRHVTQMYRDLRRVTGNRWFTAPPGSTFAQFHQLYSAVVLHQYRPLPTAAPGGGFQAAWSRFSRAARGGSTTARATVLTSALALETVREQLKK
jgi:hypothetical protein